MEHRQFSNCRPVGIVSSYPNYKIYNYVNAHFVYLVLLVWLLFPPLFPYLELLPMFCNFEDIQIKILTSTVYKIVIFYSYKEEIKNEIKICTISTERFLLGIRVCIFCKQWSVVSWLFHRPLLILLKNSKKL